jgi:predicted PhzF superfamily epimerase YddE/YHI9
MPIPSAQNLLNIENKNVVEGIIVTLKGKNDNYDFYSRQFAPWVGVDEDPVCGAAHTVLAGYWQPILKKDILKGKDRVESITISILIAFLYAFTTARQCSKRGGDLIVKIVNDQRIELKGQVAHVLQGTMRIK